MSRKAKEEEGLEEEPEEKPEDLRCKKCRKPVLIGQGNQREVKNGEERFCELCWKKCIEESW